MMILWGKYMEQRLDFVEKPVVKVLTGMRRNRKLGVAEVDFINCWRAIMKHVH